MNGSTTQTSESSSTKTTLQRTVSEYAQQCIQCHRCMDACPVTRKSFSIDELNSATIDIHLVSSTIKSFTFCCTQCGKCVPVCPVNIRRDLMMRYIKYELRSQKPWGYTRYLFIKGPDKTGINGIMQKLYIAAQKITTRDLASLMERTPLQKPDVLFYPGCYIYSTTTMRQTLRLLNHLGRPYAVLGGVTACCGAPHLLQGELDQADHCLEVLYRKIKISDPKVIITSCAECFEMLFQLKTRYNETFEVLSVVEYLLRYQDRFPAVKIRGKILVHDSCRFHGQTPQGEAARKTTEMFGEPVNPTLHQTSHCCYQWNHGSDPGNTIRQTSYLAAVKTTAPTLACVCLTCYEELKKIPTDVEIIDILQLFEDALDAKQPTERKQ